MTARTPDRDWLLPFLALSAIWGSSFMFIKVADRAFEPLQVAFGRCVLGSIVLVALLAARRERLPRGRRTWGHVFVLAIFFNSIPFSLFAWGETEVSSVVAGLWNATSPLCTLVVVLLVLPEEHPTRERVLGLLVGFAGTVLVLGPWSGFHGALLGNLACFGAAACYGIGFPYARRNLTGLPYSVVALSAAQVLVGTAQLALVMPLTSVPDSVPLDAALSLAALGAGGTGIAYLLNYTVIRRAGATLASTVGYPIPVFATLLGIVVLGEALEWNQPVGAVVVLVGVALSQGRLRRRRAPRPG